MMCFGIELFNSVKTVVNNFHIVVELVEPFQFFSFTLFNFVFDLFIAKLFIIIFHNYCLD